MTDVLDELVRGTEGTIEKLDPGTSSLLHAWRCADFEKTSKWSKIIGASSWWDE